MERYIVAAALIGLALFLMWRVGAGKTSPEQARELVEAGAALIDVRTPGEYAGGHIEGARNIPVSQIAGRVGEVGAKDAPVVVYCRSGARSANAAATLRSAGFTQVHDLGAMSRWR